MSSYRYVAEYIPTDASTFIIAWIIAANVMIATAGAQTNA